MPSKRRRCPVCTLYHPNGRRAICVQVEHRWPLGPLVELLGVQGAEAVANRLKTTGENVRRAAEFGLPDATADRWAIRAGFHPAQVWPEWIDAGLSVVDRQFLDGGWRYGWLHGEGKATEVRAA